MAVSAEQASRRYTYPDLAIFPDDNQRREIIDGDLFVSPAPSMRHQRAQGEVFGSLYNYSQVHGGQAYSAPCDVYFSLKSVVEPDVFFIRADHLDKVGEMYLDGPPDLVVEVSSPSTKRVDLARKRDLYEKFGVNEYWFVDLDAGQILVFVLGENGYGVPQMKVSGEILEPAGLPGLAVRVAKVLGV